MNTEKLKKHIESYVKHRPPGSEKYDEELYERRERESYYQGYNYDEIIEMTPEDFGEYISNLWAMLMWGNKQYVVDKLISDNGFERVKKEIAEFLWGERSIEERWDKFRKDTKGLGPAMMSELLCLTHPQKYYLWNRRAFVGMQYLEAKGLPRYNYQLTGRKYVELFPYFEQIRDELKDKGFEDSDFLLVDFFIWSELQVEPVLANVTKSPSQVTGTDKVLPKDESAKEFLHDEVKDKLADIGRWMGFTANTEVKVAEGAVVDTIWEATIGNMGRVIYVFEVQTKGSIDSLILNLLKSLNNPAVQGVVAVSDAKQIERIRNQVKTVQGLSGKLKTWDFQEVLDVHEALEGVNESINKLGLVPQGFY